MSFRAHGALGGRAAANTSSGYLVEELDLMRRSVGERLGFLGRQLQTAADRPAG
ncbi:MAG: hypothetical protein WBG67_04740 [Thermoanaerobaculia bacterium]